MQRYVAPLDQLRSGETVRVKRGISGELKLRKQFAKFSKNSDGFPITSKIVGEYIEFYRKYPE